MVVLLANTVFWHYYQISKIRQIMKIKPCPICRNDDLHISETRSNDQSITWYKITHGPTINCGISLIHDDKDLLIEQWNNRLDHSFMRKLSADNWQQNNYPLDQNPEPFRLPMQITKDELEHIAKIINPASFKKAKEWVMERLADELLEGTLVLKSKKSSHEFFFSWYKLERDSLDISFDDGDQDHNPTFGQSLKIAKYLKSIGIIYTLNNSL